MTASPWNSYELSLEDFKRLYASAHDDLVWSENREKFAFWLSEMKLPDDLGNDLQNVYIPLVNLLRRRNFQSETRIPVIGISGSQGSGKSTFTRLLSNLLENAYGYRVVSFSIDDFYHTRAGREKLAANVHPLLVTRGVPGTHDVRLGLDILDSLQKAEIDSETLLPIFDKSMDDQRPEKDWNLFKGRPDFILFEGWCVGAVPQPDEALDSPVNDLEKEHDKNGVFRKFVNDQLATAYQKWFSKISFFIMLKVPSFDRVFEWRLLQESKLAEKIRSSDMDRENLRIMSEDEIRFFISHYERITKHMLEEMPGRADMVIRIGDDHHLRSVILNRTT